MPAEPVRPGARLFERLVLEAGEVISVSDEGGHLWFVNDAPRRVLDRDPDGAVGTDATAWVHPDDVHVVERSRAELLGNPGARSYNLCRVQDAEGGWRHVETTAVNLLDDPDVGGLVYIARDVEARVQAERRAARALRGQQLVAALGVRALGGGAFGDLLDQALGDVRALLEADWVALLEPDDDGRLRQVGEHGDPDRAAVQVRSADGAAGVLVAGWTDPRPEDADDAVLLQGVADVLAGTRQRDAHRRAAVVEALHDPLTGLPTRPLLLDRLEHALRRRLRGEGGVVLLLVDLNGFKLVNDRFGHAAGDAVLRQLGPRLQGCLRPGDTAGRFGGDEFVVLCEDVPAGTTAAFAEAVGERLRAACAEPFLLSGGRRVQLSGSVGTAGAEPGPAPLEVDVLLHAADEAMYADKRRSDLPSVILS